MWRFHIPQEPVLSFHPAVPGMELGLSGFSAQPAISEALLFKVIDAFSLFVSTGITFSNDRSLATLA